MAAKKKASKKPIKKVAAKPERKRAAVKSPRSQTLPGLEQVRNRILDNACEGIHDTRRDMAQSRQEETSLLQSALREMQGKGVTVYRHSGVELALVPGDVHLRVRTVKEKANSNRAAEVDPSEKEEGVTREEIEAEEQHEADKYDTGEE